MKLVTLELYLSRPRDLVLAPLVALTLAVSCPCGRDSPLLDNLYLHTSSSLLEV